MKDKQSISSIILNTDPISKPGQHWVAIVKRPERGHHPVDYHPIFWYNLRRCHHNAKDYQQDFSTVCGDYCLFFKNCFLKRNNSTNEIFLLDKYLDEDDDASNDRFVCDTVHPKILNNERHQYLLSKPQKSGYFLWWTCTFWKTSKKKHFSCLYKSTL